MIIGVRNIARIRKSKVDTTNFAVIPKHHELDDEELIKRKYKGKRILMKDDKYP
jgi:hypothetical protein